MPPIPVYAWNAIPDSDTLAVFLARHPEPKHLLFCLSPDQTLQRQPESRFPALAQSLCEAMRCTVFDAVNFIAQWQPETDLWLLPPHAARRLHEHFPQPGHIVWQTPPVPQEAVVPLKAWQMPPAPRPPEQDAPPHILIIGAGIAGAATAYECAIRGARVTVLDAAAAAGAASGNRQGLLYAKISPHNTAQTELLLSGYGYTRRLLQRLFPQEDVWQGCGILHLNHSEAERKRNAALAQNRRHSHLYRAVSAAEASALAGIPLQQDALFWPQGAWLNPPALVRRLLAHPQITLYEHAPVLHAGYADGAWYADTPQGTFSGSHIVFCTGAGSLHAPVIGAFPFQAIRGQTATVPATEGSLKFKTALSGASYISPAWQGEHCFGATFAPNDTGADWRSADELANRAALAELSPHLAGLFASRFAADTGSLKPPHAHAAVRCDCRDHLPAVGPLGDAQTMRTVYAKYASDKNYRIATPCPYLPNAYANTAHGSRGLATAPLCAAEIAAQIFGTPRPLSERLRQALNPNRLVIGQIVRRTG